MPGHLRRVFAVTSRAPRDRARVRARRSRRMWVLEGLEDRLLLSGSPTIYTVNSTGNGTTGTGDSGTLPYVIGQANANANPAGSEIQFDPTVFGSPQTITLASTLVLSETAGPEVIDGPGANLVTVSGNNAVQVFSVSAGVTATITGQTISNGSADRYGGGIDNNGSITITNSTIENSSAVFGGGIFNNGMLTVTDSTIDDNNADVNGPGGGAGGGILNDGTLTVTNSTVADNLASIGAGIENGGILTITNSTIANNSCGDFGGGIDNDGGTLTVTDSTIADNSATDGNGGGILNLGTLTITDSSIANNSAINGGGGILNIDALTVTNSTVADNTAAIGGGIDNSGGTLTVTNSTISSNNVFSGGAGGGLDGTATLDNTIVALNTMGSGTTTSASDIAGTASSNSAYNLIGTGGSGGLIGGANGNMVGVADPGLDPNGLQDNGGPTQTISLVAGSPAIAAGSLALAVDPGTGQPLTTDQRSTGFPRTVNNTVDIGAFEFHSALFLGMTAQPPDNIQAGTSFGVTVVARNSSGTVDTSFNGTVTVALENNPGGATLGGTLSVAAVAGMATFSGLTINNPGVGYTLQCSASGLTAATTAAFTAWVPQLVVTAQPPGAVSTGSGFGLTVADEDNEGNVLTSFNGTVTVALATNPGGATLGGTLSVTAQSGVATFSGLTVDKVGTGYVLRVSGNGLVPATTSVIDVQTNTAPTHYTVDLTSDTGAGSGSEGDLRYVIVQADANPNPLGSIIQFDPTVFASPQTITLASTMVLSETAGPEVIDGPGSSLVTVSGGGAVEVFSVVSGVTAFLSGLTIAGGLATQGGGLSIVGGTVSLTNVNVINNQAVGAKGADGNSSEPGGDGGSGLGGGIYLNGGSLTLMDDTIGSDVARGGTGGNAGSTTGFFERFGTGDGGPADGGGLYVADGTRVLNDDVFQSNQAIGGAGDRQCGRRRGIGGRRRHLCG